MACRWKCVARFTKARVFRVTSDCPVCGSMYRMWQCVEHVCMLYILLQVHIFLFGFYTVHRVTLLTFWFKIIMYPLVLSNGTSLFIVSVFIVVGGSAPFDSSSIYQVFSDPYRCNPGLVLAVNTHLRSRSGRSCGRPHFFLPGGRRPTDIVSC